MDVPSRLRRAIVSNDLSLTRRILTNNPSYLQNPDLNNGNTSLHLAALYGHTAIAEYLVSLGHDSTSPSLSPPSSRDSNSTSTDSQNGPSHDHDSLVTLNPSSLGISHNTYNSTPLHLAAANGHTRTIQLLCRHFPQTVNRRDRDGATPLMLASRGHSAATATAPHPFFLQSSKGSTIATSTAHHSALDSDDTSPLTVLLSSTPVPSSVTARDHAGNTCLHYASAWGNLKALRVLIQAGADPTAQNTAKWTPQYYSLTVQAEVYYRGLILEWDRLQRGPEGREISSRVRKGGEERRGVGVGAGGRAVGGGGVRLVTRQDDPDEDEEEDERRAGGERARASSGGTNMSSRGRGQSDGMGELGLSLGRVDTWK